MILTNQNILITGCGGMLGSAVYTTFKVNNNVLASDIDQNEPWLEYLDVRDLESLLKISKSFKPDLIINLAALTDLEYCENHPNEAFVTNGLGQENICLVANTFNIPVVYISTAGIFDGEKDYYHDFDLPNPLSIYGKSKYYGELMTIKSLKKFFVFRAGWMMGGVKKDKKFIKKIFNQIVTGQKELFVVEDKLGTPTYTWDFANSMKKVIKTDYWGLYNMVCEGSASRFDVAKEFIRNLKLEKSIKIKIVPSEYFKEEYFAPRPKSEKLVNLKLNERKIMFMHDWKVCLKEYSNDFLKIINI